MSNAFVSNAFVYIQSLSIALFHVTMQYDTDGNDMYHCGLEVNTTDTGSMVAPRLPMSVVLSSSNTQCTLNPKLFKPGICAGFLAEGPDCLLKAALLLCFR